MRRVATVVTLLIATAMGAITPSRAQTPLPNNIPPVTTRTLPTPLGWYAIGTIGCAAVSPMIATVVLGRELTMNEAYRSMLGCVGGPLGWVMVCQNGAGPHISMK